MAVIKATGQKERHSKKKKLLQNISANGSEKTNDYNIVKLNVIN